ncbi:MAG: hypothetical protein QOG83_281, partial [Alphaproteobacteria bacterium]|nr:hypothetical protein [Alphaproteobacteria bacterium]
TDRTTPVIRPPRRRPELYRRQTGADKVGLLRLSTARV